MNSNPNPVKVLLVDDHASVRTSMRDWLEIYFPQYEFIEAEDGEQAIQFAEERCPSLVLMDIGLPGVSGLDAARSIIENQPAVKIIFLSIHDETHYRLEANNIGGSAFISKAEMRARLLPAITNALSNRNEGQA